MQLHCSISDLKSIANDHLEIELNDNEALQLLTKWNYETEEMLWNYFFNKLNDWSRENGK